MVLSFLELLLDKKRGYQNNMKIQLQNVLYHPSTGGIESYLYYVSKKLKEMGHEPNILSSQHIKTLPKYDSYENIEIIRHPYYKINIFPLNILSPIYFIKRLEKFINKVEKNSTIADYIKKLYFEIL